MYEIIKKFLDEGGKCLLIEDGKPVGVILTMEEYELLRSKPQIANHKLQTNEINPDLPPQSPPYQGGDKGEVASHPISKAMAKEADLSNVKIDELDFGLSSDDITLEDLGLDEVSE